MVENIKTSTFVIDASAMLSYIFPDEPTPKDVMLCMRKLARSQIVALAPVLLKFEIGNALKSAVKQKRIDEIDAQNIFIIFNDLKINFITPDLSETLRLSLKHNLSFYDASYLCLTQEKKAKLLTLDKKLQATSKI